MNKEIWKDIKGYEGLYQVSNLGNVKRKKHILFKTLRNYYGVKLCKNNIKCFKYIHRLVAETFIPNLENKPQVNHKDGNKLNNNVENLEWVTISENGKHAYRIGLEKPNKISPVIQYDLNRNFIKEYSSIKEAQSKNKKCSKISDCCQGKRKTAGGYIWEYKNKEERK